MYLLWIFCPVKRRYYHERRGLLLDDMPISTSEAARVVPKYKETSRSQCLLLRYTWERQWERVVERCESDPQEACCVTTETGRTALHLACFNHACPTFVARALIDTNPHALLVQDSCWGWTPLHSLCAFQAGDHLIPLFCERTTRVERALGWPGLQKSQQSPLLLACKRNAPWSTLAALLKVRRNTPNSWIAPVTGCEPYWTVSGGDDDKIPPLAALVDARGSEPLSHVSAATLRTMKIRTAALFDFPYSAFQQDLTTVAHVDDSFDETVHFWDKCMRLLKEAWRTELGHGKTLVHLLSSLVIPVPSLLRLSLDMFPPLALQRDGKGLIPLHHVLLHPYLNATTLKLMIHIILSRQPDSAGVLLPRNVSPLADGGYPLELALRRGLEWDEGVALLVTAAPQALELQEWQPEPALVAATMDAKLDTIYRLIRTSPEFLQNCSR